MTAWRGERGAVLVQTGIALIGLLAFGSMSVDYGVLWVARGQAQNAADAAALAGAITLAFGDASNMDALKARATAVAVATAVENTVWGAPPVVAPGDVTFPLPCPPGAPGIPDLCIRVNVYRNQERNNPLPTLFAQLVGVMEHGVKATATAQVAVGTSSNCLRPWAIPDKWDDLLDNDPPKDNRWTLDDKFERYYEQGSNKGELITPIRDIFRPPVGTDPGSGYTVENDLGRRVTLKVGHPKDTITGGFFLPIALPIEGSDNGGNNYRDNIARCNGSTFSLDSEVETEEAIDTEPGRMVGPTSQGMADLIALDPGAYWMCFGNGSPYRASSNEDCAGAPSTGASPRLVPVPVFDVQDYMDDKYANGEKTTGRFSLKITRLLGFFVEEMQGNTVIGRVTYYPSASGVGSGNAASGNFLRKVILVR